MDSPATVQFDTGRPERRFRDVGQVRSCAEALSSELNARVYLNLRIAAEVPRPRLENANAMDLIDHTEVR